MLLNYVMNWDVFKLQLLIGITAELKQLRETVMKIKNNIIFWETDEILHSDGGLLILQCFNFSQAMLIVDLIQL